MLRVSTNTLTTRALDAEITTRAQKRVDAIPPDLKTRRRTARRILADARREQIAIEHMVTVPAEGESLHIIIDGRFEPCDFIPATRRLCHPATIARLEITTLGFNSDNIACICNGMDQGKIGQVLIVCSHYFEKSDRELFALAKKEIEDRGGTILGLRTHCKLMLLEMSDGRHFTIEGSGNLRSCKSIEQFCMTNDRDLLLFHRNWLHDYIESTGKK